MRKEYNLNFTDNNISNDYLRCLWYRLRCNFGKIAWNLMPIKLGQQGLIHIGNVDLGVQTKSSNPTSISCTYSKKGCLKSLIFENSNLIDPKSFTITFDKSIEEAKEFDKYLKDIGLNISLDKNMTFEFTEGRNFKLKNNDLLFKYKFYDEEDCRTYSQYITKILIALLSFDSLRFVSLSKSGVEKLRTQNKTTFNVSNIDDENEAFSICSNNKFQGIIISEYMIDYIDMFLDRKLDYENQYNKFEKSVLAFSQALFFEELSNTQFELDFSPQEYATTSYMSAIEIITLDDIKPSKCEECGQERYSIAKRVISLAENATGNNTYLKKVISKFYSMRSKFVHAGEYQSTSNYTGTSSPLLSKKESDGLIKQAFNFDPNFKQLIKNCILWHEKMN